MNLVGFSSLVMVVGVVVGQQAESWDIHVAYVADEKLSRNESIDVDSEDQNPGSEAPSPFWDLNVAYQAPPQDDLKKAASVSPVLPSGEVKIEQLVVPTNIPKECQQTTNKCQCKKTWTFAYNGQVSNYTGCANPDNDLYSSWCILEETEDCVMETPPLGRIQSTDGVSGGWFDRCLPDCPIGSGMKPSQDQCYRTVSGCTCKEAWNFQGSAQYGCKNPDGDSLGSWCEVVLGSCNSSNRVRGGQFQNDVTGEILGEWDYCLKECDGPGKKYFGISSK